MLGSRLKFLRGKRTQEDVAKAISVSRARYSHYENGRSEPDTQTLEKLADFFNVSTDYLLGRTDNPDLIQEKNEESLLDPELGVFFKEIKNAPEDRQEQLRKIWEIIKSEGNREVEDD
ncbi:XRE family transcriptional regulator [Priestia veravalensis]|uniref:XRE family transcriptional regulator n=1 Tax=Priestia veravalensis TaxID=1414648 RepID=A0A0V8JSH9_9BACI|nr:MULTISPECIES: helix-turn-helix transcriptional regulator [Priestia]KSU89836.1 XRE family transcriptional regulator [Priestia veravalensis]SCB74590.1 transcriptional regulator [Priestia flexa]